MIWKSLNDKFLRLLFIAFLFCGFTFTLHAQESHFDRLKEQFERNKVFRAEFHHESIDSYTGDTVASRGRIWVGKQRYKIRGRHQTVVVNGQTSMVYDKNRNRVIISKYEPSEDDFAPSRILNGIDSTFTVEVQEKRENQIYIRLISDDPFAIYKQVEIYLSQGLIPQKIRAVDPVDNIITTTFKKGEFIGMREDLFKLDYPSGAEVIDMRN